MNDLDVLSLIIYNMIKKSQKVRVRFPNKSEYVIIENFRLGYFESVEDYDNEIYGKYKGEYVMVNKDDFIKIIT
jgi:hypothetical protein